MATPRDNIFQMFQGGQGGVGRREGRRQFPVGPSQIGNLPGNFPAPSASPPPPATEMAPLPSSETRGPRDAKPVARIAHALRPLPP